MSSNLITSGAHDIHKRHKSLLPCLVDKLGTVTSIPDKEIIKQDDFKDDDMETCMYFIGKGNCQVRVRDPNGQDQKIAPLLREGDHFGEIGMIYLCRRTATVTAKNYNTFARIVRGRYKEMISEFPEYEVCLKRYIKETY
jgi:CRP-like cAMP-binding protein